MGKLACLKFFWPPAVFIGEIPIFLIQNSYFRFLLKTEKGVFSASIFCLCFSIHCADVYYPGKAVK